MVSAPPTSSSLTPLGRLDPALINRAVHALLKHHSATSSESTSLFENELDVQVQLSLLRIPGNSSPKPIRIDIPHSFLHIGRDSQDNDGEEDGDVAMQDGAASSSSPPEICLIVKDSLKPTLQTLLSRVSATSDSSSSHPHAASTLSCIKKILTLTSLRQKHKTFSQKRELLAKYDLFLADDRILPMLPKALGKGFFHKKKQPLPICLTRNIGDAESDRDVTGLAMRLDTLLKATYLHLSSGTCLTVKAGTTSMSPERLVENIAAIAEKAPMKVPRKWANVRSISIKTTESVALPVYNKSPEEIEELLYLARVEKREDGVGEGEDVAEEKKEEKKKKRKDMAESTPLGKALKKQKSLEKKAKERNDEKPAEIKDDTDDTAVKVNETTRAETVEKEDEKDTARKAKKAKKEKKKAEAVVVPPDDDDDHKPTEEKLPTETPKSSKKKSKKKSKTEESDVEPMKEETENHDQKTPENAPPAKTPKSSKKRKEMKEINDESTAATPATSKTSDKSSTKKKSKEVKESKSKGDVASSPTDEAFIPSKKFQGSKPGYVFRKDKKGLGYYKDVVPVVDKAWLKSLKTMGRGGGGGGRSKRGVSNTPAKRRKGGSRRSF